MLRPNWSSTSDDGGFLAALVAREQLQHLLAHPVEVRAQLDQDLRGDAFALADQAEQDVLGADVVVAELQRFAQRQLQHLLRPGREGDVPARGLLPLADDLLDLLADTLQRDTQRLQRLGGDTLTLVDQTQKDVLGADVVVVEHPGLFLSQDDHPPRAVGEPLKHVHSLDCCAGGPFPSCLHRDGFSTVRPL